MIRVNDDKAYCLLYKHPYVDVRVSHTENMALPATAYDHNTAQTLHYTTQHFVFSHVSALHYVATFMVDFILVATFMSSNRTIKDIH